MISDFQRPLWEAAKRRGWEVVTEQPLGRALAVEPSGQQWPRLTHRLHTSLGGTQQPSAAFKGKASEQMCEIVA